MLNKLQQMAIQLIPNNPNNFDWFYKLFVLGCCSVVFLVIFSQFKSCGNVEPTPLDNTGKKNTIQKQKLKADSLDKASDKTDSVRIIYVTKWQTLKPKLDSIPCPEALAKIIVLTDSIITIDSTQISQLNAELYVKDLVIANQDTIIKNDSIAFKKLSKKLKWQKVKTKAVAVGMGALLGASLLLR